MTNDTNTAKEVRSIMEQYADSKIINLAEKDGVPPVDVVVLPAGKTIHSIKKYYDEYLTAPERRKGTATHKTVDSFVAHVNRFKDEDSVVYADQTYNLEQGKLPSIMAVLNYHRATPEGAPRFGDHRSVYNLTLSDQWKEWISMNEKPFESQSAFAEFIEKNIENVFYYEPGSNPRTDELIDLIGGKMASPSRLMELSRGMSIGNSEKVTQKINPSTGESTFVYESEHTATGTVDLVIPNAFLINIPVLLDGVLYSILVRLRYRLKDKKVTWSYSMYRKEKIFEDAFSGVCNVVKAGVNLPMFMGSPE